MASVTLSAVQPHATVRLRRTLIGLALAAAALAFGILLGVLGGIGGPLLVVGLPVGVLLTAAVLAHPPLGVMVVYAIFPVAFLALPSPGVPLQVVDVAVLAITAAIVMRRLGVGLVPLAATAELWWGLAFVSWALVATPGALDVASALKQDAQLVGGFLFALAVISACRSMRDVRRVVGALLVVGTAMCADGLRHASDLRAAVGGDVVANRLQGVFTHPNDLGAFAAILLTLALGMAVGGRGRWNRALSVAAVAVTVAALMLTLSRGAWMGTALSGLAMLYLVPALRRALVVVGVPLLVIAAMVGAFRSTSPELHVVRERLDTLGDPLANPYDDRPSIWREAAREIREHPWTGLGPGNFPVASARAGSLSQSVGAIHAHNVPLTVAAETGLPNVLFLFGLTVAVGLAVLRTLRMLDDPGDRAVVAALGAALLTQVGQGLVDFNLRNPVLHTLMWSLVGLVLAARRQADHRMDGPLR